ncbi:hypothetical protein [Streptomyces sp. SCL15-6]|uniref:TolB family protein n=1 Tax=Streptomyces sp. SCL15-6 TaxID=2967222 RepID=UPI002967793D|nr:hypothetical protein [Streptomyces sp. SCL15-6]
MIGDTPLVDDQETFPFRASWLDGERFLHTADGRVHVRSLHGSGTRTIGFSAAVTTRRPRYARRRSDFESTGPRPVRGIGSPVLSPDGGHVAFQALNDIYVMKIGRAPKPLTRDQWWKCNPAWSPDGKRLAYSTDRGGTLDIWIRDLDTGRDRQLTKLGTKAALSGAWSPSGKEIAFLDQDGALWTADVASGDVRQIFTATFEPGRPTWSPDGETIALAAVKPYSARFREGLSQLLPVDRTTGQGRYVEAVAGRSIQTRGTTGRSGHPTAGMREPSIGLVRRLDSVLGTGGELAARRTPAGAGWSRRPVSTGPAATRSPGTLPIVDAISRWLAARSPASTGAICWRRPGWPGPRARCARCSGSRPNSSWGRCRPVAGCACCG